jgi:hypothetical protein
MTKHTPGPWEFDDKHSSGFPLLCLYAADNRNPFHGSRSDDEQNANARLIAAAPELLEALRAITDQLERIGDTRYDKDGQYIDAARAAIAKATGEQK